MDEKQSVSVCLRWLWTCRLFSYNNFIVFVFAVVIVAICMGFSSLHFSSNSTQTHDTRDVPFILISSWSTAKMWCLHPWLQSLKYPDKHMQATVKEAMLWRLRKMGAVSSFYTLKYSRNQFYLLLYYWLSISVPLYTHQITIHVRLLQTKHDIHCVSIYLTPCSPLCIHIYLMSHDSHKQYFYCVRFPYRCIEFFVRIDFFKSHARHQLAPCRSANE